MQQIVAADRRIAAFAQADPIVALLATAPSVGPITASAVVATIDDVTRFPSAHQFEAFLGLVPGERSSGEKRRHRAHHEGGQLARAVSAGRGGLAHSRARKSPRRRRCARGRSRSPRAVATGSPWSRWRVASRGFCTRCGETTRRTTPRSFACRGRHRTRELVARVQDRVGSR